MSEETFGVLLDILQIVVPAILIVGGGALTWWKYLRTRAEEQSQRRAEYKLQVEEAAWSRVKHTMEMQAGQIDDQGKRIGDLEKTVKESRACIHALEEKCEIFEKNVRLLERKNHMLLEENKELKSVK